MGLFDGFKNAKDDHERKVIAADRSTLEGFITDIQGIAFNQYRVTFGDELVNDFVKYKREVIDILEKVDPSLESTWEIDDYMTKVIKALKTSLTKKSAGSIMASFRALKYIAITRGMKLSRNDLNTRLGVIENHLVIIDAQTVVDTTRLEVRRQEEQKASLQEKYNGAVTKSKNYIDSHPIAAEQVKAHKNQTDAEYQFSPEAMELRALMNSALDLKREVENIAREISSNKEKIESSSRMIDEAETHLVIANDNISVETLKLAEESRKRLLQQLDDMRKTVDAIRASQEKFNAILVAMDNTEEEKRKTAKTNYEYEKMIEEERMKAVREEEARGKLLKAKADEAKKEAAALKKLQEQQEENQRIIDEANAEKEQILHEAEKMRQQEAEEVVEEEPIMYC